MFANIVIGVFNFVGLLVSISGFPDAVRRFVHHDNGSSKWAMLVLVIFLMAISIVGLIASTRNSRVMMLIYLLMLLLIIIATICYMVVIFVVITKTPTAAVEANKEFQLNEFMSSLRKYVVNDKEWAETRSSLVQGKYCKEMLERHRRWITSGSSPGGEDVSVIKFGCCRPPTHCGFELRNHTFWFEPKQGLVSNEHDCVSWSNNEDVMCYDCETCKAAHVAEFVIGHRRSFPFGIGFLILLLIIFNIACCALRNCCPNIMHRERL